MPEAPVRIVTGKALRALGKKIVEEHATLTGELKKLRPFLSRLRGPQREALKPLIEEYLPDEATWKRKPLTIRKTSLQYLAEAEQLRAAAYWWKAGGRLREALECEAAARKAERKGKQRRTQGN